MKWLIGFLILYVYAVGIPHYSPFVQILNQQPYYWFAFWFGFFLIAFLIAKLLLEDRGLRSFGLDFNYRWISDLSVGFLIGALIWALKNILFYFLGRFNFHGFIELAAIPRFLITIIIVAFFPAIINDLLIRGYTYRFFKKEQILKWYIIVTSVLYAADDIWLEGFGFENTMFSLFLGISLAYTVLRTGRLWMSIGIHTGINFIYRAIYGIDGKGIVNLEAVSENIWFDYLSIAITAIIFPIVYMVLISRKGDHVDFKG